MPYPLSRRALTLCLVLGGAAQVPLQAHSALPKCYPGSPFIAAGSQVHVPSADGPGGPRLSKLLLDARRSEKTAAEIRTSAAAFGSASIPALLDVLEAGAFHERRKGGGVIIHALDAEAQMGLASALNTFHWETVRRRIEHRLKEAPTLSRRRALLIALGVAVPDGALLDLLGPLAEVPRSQERALRAPLKEALATALQRTTELHDEIGPFYDATPPSFLRTVIDAVKSGGDQASLAGLALLLGRVPDADPLLMIEISDLAKTVVRPVPERTLNPIRAALKGRNECTRLEAAKALGRLDDVAAVPLLIEALQSTSLPLRTEAKVALDRLSAERFGADAAAWAQWHSDSLAWLRGEAPKWRSDLRSGDQSRVSRALLQVARYRIHRYELVEDVGRALGSGDENTSVVACAVLGHFATDKSIEPLLKALEHRSVEVRKAALEALERATGADHGEKAEDWREAGWPRS